MKKALLFIFTICSFNLGAQITFSSNNTGGGNWEVGTTWNQTSCPSGCTAGVDYPGPADSVVINVGDAIATTVNDSCKSITQYVNNNFISSLTVPAGDTLTISNIWEIYSTANNCYLSINISGKVDVAGDFSTTITHTILSADFTVLSGGELNFNKLGGTNTVTHIGGGPTPLNFNTAGSLNVLGTMVANVGNSNSDVNFNIDNFTTINQLTLNRGSGTDNDIVVDIDDTLDVNNITYLNATGAADEIVIDMTTTNAAIYLSGSMSVINTGTLDADPSNNSSFIYDGSGPQNLTILPTFEYHDLVVNNTNTLTIGTDLPSNNILGDLIIENGGTMSSNGNNINLDNNLTVHTGGTLTIGSTDTLNFEGNALQTVNGSQSFGGTFLITNTSSSGVNLSNTSDFTFNDLTIETNGEFSSDTSFSIQGNLVDSGDFNALIAGDTMMFTGSSAQTIFGQDNYGNVLVSNASGLVIGASSDSIVFGDLTIPSGGVITAGNTAFSLTGDWTNNHGKSGLSYTDGQRVTFSGSTPQDIAGSDTTEFFNLNVNNSGVSPTLNVNSQTDIINSIDVTLGQVDLNAKVRLVSNDNGTAVVGDLTGGPATPFIDDLIAERWMNEDDSTNWYLIAPQVATGDTVGAWNDDLYTAGFPGSDLPGELVYITPVNYNEATEMFPAPANMVASLNHGTSTSGWFALSWVGKLLDIQGTPHTGPITIGSLGNSGGTPGYTGFNLIGNPYASHVYVDSLAPTNITGVGGAYYVIQNDGSGNYVTYNGDGNGDIIASGEAFYVETAPATTGSVGFQENDKAVNRALDSYNSVRTTELNPTLTIHMDANSGARVDEAAVTLNAASTIDYDWNHENTEFGNENNYLNIGTEVNSKLLELNAIPYDAATVRYPIKIYRKYWNQGTTDSYVITFNNVSNFSAENKCIVLEDSVTGQFIPITTDGQTYSFSSLDSEASRLFLNINSPADITVTDPVCANTADGKIVVEGSANNSMNYLWLDANADTIQYTQNTTSADSIESIQEGTYTVIVENNGTCGNTLSNIVVEAPISNATASFNTTHVSCYDANDGAVTLTTDISTPTYEWSTGETTNSISNVSAGNYFVTITDQNSCTITKQVEVENTEPIINSIITTENGCHGSDNASASVSFTSYNDAHSIAWSNGSTSQQINSLIAGSYTVTVTHDNSQCSQVDNITITDPAELIVSSSVQNTTCHDLDNGSATISISGGVPNYSYTWNNSSFNGSTITNVYPGSYGLEVADANGCVKSFQIEVGSPDEVVSNFETAQPMYDINQAIAFTNTSTGASISSWNFGDNNTSLLDNPSHSYTAYGTYDVELISTNDSGCVDTIVKQVVIDNSVSIVENTLEDNKQVLVYRSLDNVMISTSFSKSQNISIKLTNNLGQLIGTSKKYNAVMDQNFIVSLPEQSGIYFVVIENESKIIHTGKIMK